MSALLCEYIQLIPQLGSEQLSQGQRSPGETILSLVGNLDNYVAIQAILNSKYICCFYLFVFEFTLQTRTLEANDISAA